jgi:deazaflavin-dependent oxidoreductase (nitroreductase family)
MENGMSERNEFNQRVIDDFRANQGKVGAQMAGLPLLLLTTTGAKTGRALTKPLAYTKDGDRIFVIASFAGSPNNPAWFNNLVANPTVTVEVGSERFQARAVVTTGEERQRLFNTQADKIPIFHDYQKKTTRQIPVVVFERIG